MSEKTPKNRTPKKPVPEKNGSKMVKLEVVRDISPKAPHNRHGEAIVSSTRYYADGTKRADRFTSMLYATLADMDGADGISTQVAVGGHLLDQLVLAHAVLLHLHANLQQQAQDILIAGGDDGEGAKQVRLMREVSRAMLAVQFLRLAKNQLPKDGESPATDFLALTGRGSDAGLAALVDGDQVFSSDAAKKARQMFNDLEELLKGEEATAKGVKRIVVDPADPASLDSAIDLLRSEVANLEKKRKNPNDKKQL